MTCSYETVAICSMSQDVFGSIAARSLMENTQSPTGARGAAGVLWNLISNIVVARQEVGMPPRVGNVIPLRPRNSRPEALPVSMDRLGAAVRELDGLRRCVEQIGTPSELVDGGVAGSLRPADAANSRYPGLAGGPQRDPAGRWPDTEWAVLVRARRAEVERRLLDVSMAMNALVTAERDSTDAAVAFVGQRPARGGGARSERAHRQ